MDSFSIIRLIVLHNSHFNFSIQALTLMQCVFAGPIAFEVINLVPFRLNPANLRMTNLLSRLINLLFKHIFLYNYRFDFFRQGCTRKFPVFRVVLGEAIIESVHTMGSRLSKKARSFLKWTDFEFQTRVTPKQLT